LITSSEKPGFKVCFFKCNLCRYTAVLCSRHERSRPRTRERALLYMEDLVRSLDAPTPVGLAHFTVLYA
jgi:hypothetical protein